MTIYSAVVALAILGVLLYGTASSALAQVVGAGAVARWGPSLMMLAFLAAGYWGAVQGPVVFSPADVAVLLGAPLPRSELVARPLRRSLVLGGLAGALAAGVLIVGLTGAGRHADAVRMLGLGIALGLAGVICVAFAWLVSSRAGVERALRVWSWPVAALAGALAIGAASGGRVGRAVALWSGPWGWAVQPGAGLGAGHRGWIGGVGAVAVFAALSVAVAWRRRGDGATERFAQRAEGRAHLQASMMALDARTSRRSLAEVASGGAAGAALAGSGARRLSGLAVRRPRSRRGAELAVLWRGVVSAAGRPQRVGLACGLAAGGAALVLIDVKRPVGVIVGALLIYGAAAWLLEPMRIELDVPSRTSVFLGARPGRVLLAHTVFPSFVIGGSLAVCAVALALAGQLGGGDLTAAIVLVVTAPAVTCCAAMSARRGGRLPEDVLIAAVTSDPSGGGVVLTAWLALWPAVAAAIVFVPVRAIHMRSAALGVLVSAAFGVAAAVVAGIAVSRDPRDG